MRCSYFGLGKLDYAGYFAYHQELMQNSFLCDFRKRQLVLWFRATIYSSVWDLTVSNSLFHIHSFQIMKTLEENQISESDQWLVWGFFRTAVCTIILQTQKT